MAGNELPCHPVDGVKESVLRRLCQNLARASIDAKVEQHQLLDAVEVPVIVGYGLKIPLELPSGEIHGQNRTGIQVVQVLRAAEFLCPRLRIPGSHVNQVGVGIVSESIP